jgi:hypothetical protein
VLAEALSMDFFLTNVVRLVGACLVDIPLGLEDVIMLGPTRCHHLLDIMDAILIHSLLLLLLLLLLRHMDIITIIMGKFVSCFFDTVLCKVLISCDIVAHLCRFACFQNIMLVLLPLLHRLQGHTHRLHLGHGDHTTTTIIVTTTTATLDPRDGVIPSKWRKTAGSAMYASAETLETRTTALLVRWDVDLKPMTMPLRCP